MADMTQQAPLRIMENVLVKIDKFVFPCNFVVIHMSGILREMMILHKELVTSEQETSDHINAPNTPNPQSEEEELSSKENLDEWLRTEMQKHISEQEEENEEDALIVIMKSIVEECKAIYK
nr:hypothetical protein [Tanacetum cinerariifolium]